MKDRSNMYILHSWDENMDEMDDDLVNIHCCNFRYYYNNASWFSMSLTPCYQF